MVSHPYGSGFNSLRGHAFVESNPRCSGSCVAHRLVRDRVRSPGDYFWLPVAQLSDIPCALVSRKSLFLLPHSTPVRESTSKVGKGLYSSFWIQPFRGWVFHPVASRENSRDECLFFATNCVRSGFVGRKCGLAC